MNVQWLLEDNVFDENIEAFKRAITAQGMTYKVYHHTVFEGLDVYLFGSNDCVLTYGSLGLASDVLRKTNWMPGAWCNSNELECVSYYNDFGKYLLNSNYIMLPFGELTRQKDYLFKILGDNGKFFVRPSSGFKLFTGQVVSYDKFEAEVKELAFYDVAPNKLVVCSAAVDLLEEWRLVVVDKKVVTGSQYKIKGELEVSRYLPSEVIDYGNLVAQSYKFKDPFVLDICRTANNELKVVELNSFSCSGLYDCDIDAIVAAASAVAYEEWQSYEQEDDSE